MTEHRTVCWFFSKSPLWFSGAILRGLEAARYDWVYLLNSDMIVDPGVFSSLLPWRATHVFAIASQIYFKDPVKRREETGWTRFTRVESPIEILDTPPDDDTTVRGNFYAGGGSSLFQRELLTDFARHSSVYDPFYWEDVEWGTRAWRRGYEVLFCPSSKVWHEHRATNRKFFAEAEIDRIVRRNRIVYHLRNSPSSGSGRELRGTLSLLDRSTLLEILQPIRLFRIFTGRLQSASLPFKNLSLEYTWQKYYLRPGSQSSKPLVLVVTPYAVYPPAHGGARRTHAMLEALANQFDIVLLSDEVEGYSNASRKYFAALRSIHLAGGRIEGESNSRIQRIISHSHPALAEQLRFLLNAYQPAIVQIEYVELSQLVGLREERVPWFLTLHDVLLSEGGSSPEDAFETKWIQRYDAVITCSEEDAQLVSHKHVAVIPNGAVVNRTCAPSADRAAILFLGPFRYQPNFDGIQEFLESVYQPLRRRLPELELWILGGRGSPKAASAVECFDQLGVRVIDYVEEPGEWLEQCSLTINPLRGVRGSCVKVIESVAAGRVCVSTREGARGFLNSGFPGLVLTESVQGFIEPLSSLLLDHNYRRSLESVPSEKLFHSSWKHSAEKQANLYYQWTN